MTFLLDTNVVSELRKKPDRADPGVRQWAARQPVQQLHLSVITILELDLGVERVSRRDGTQGAVLRRWLESRVIEAFASRILAVDLDVARAAARLHVPDPRPERDVLIAATALTHGLTVVTRNTQDFSGIAADVLNPWS